MKMKSPFHRKAQLAFESAILALLVVGAMSFRGIAVSTESDRWVRHTHQALENLQSPLSTMLDLNLPKKHGRQVLEEIKQSPALKSIPVVILTTSASEEDILRSYRLPANCYITKPVDLNGFLTVVKSIDSFWLSVVRLPHEGRS